MPPIYKNLEPNANHNNNGHGSHWGQLPYDNKLDETNTSVVRTTLYPLGPPFVHLTLLQKS